MPSAIASTPAAVKPGVRPRERRPSRRSSESPCKAFIGHSALAGEISAAALR
jgi:hypothetical protein